MLPRLKAIYLNKGLDVVRACFESGELLLSSGNTLNVDRVKIIRGTGIYECTRRCDEVGREIFEGDTIEWVQDEYFIRFRGKVCWYEKKGYFGVEVEGTEDIILLCRIKRPEIVERAFEE